MAHKDIRKEFKVKDEDTNEVRRFEAVGFLNEGEPPVDGDEMLRRVSGENGGAIGEEDCKFLDAHRDQKWSRKLWPYYLATSRRNPDDPRDVSYFHRYGDRWRRSWDSLDRRWYGNGLVVRRIK